MVTHIAHEQSPVTDQPMAEPEIDLGKETREDHFITKKDNKLAS